MGDFQGRVDAFRAIRGAIALYRKYRSRLLAGESPEVAPAMD
jgi:hypothetical protein